MMQSNIFEVEGSLLYELSSFISFYFLSNEVYKISIYGMKFERSRTAGYNIIAGI